MANRQEEEDREIARQARGLKRGLGHWYLVLIGLALLLMALSPIFNRYLGTWQGVVVAPPEGGEIEVMRHDTIVGDLSVPEELAAGLSVGDYLLKRRMTWNPVRIDRSELTEMPTIDDPARQPPRLLPAYFERYVSAWAGVVVEVRRQTLPRTSADQPGEKVTVVLALDDGGTREMPVPDDLLGHVREGTRIEKPARSWGMVVTAQGVRPPPSTGDAPGEGASGSELSGPRGAKSAEAGAPETP